MMAAAPVRETLLCHGLLLEDSPLQASSLDDMGWLQGKHEKRLTAFYVSCRDEPYIMSAGSKPPIARMDRAIPEQQQQHMKGAAVL